MRITSLKIANVRAIEAAEFRFRSGFNLIVGVNGVGKTSVLDALGVCLSAFVKQANRLRTPVQGFTLDDIRVSASALSVECSAQIGETEYQYVIHKPRDASAPRETKEGMPREQALDTPERSTFLGVTPSPVKGNEPAGRPLAVLYSTKRAVPSERAPRESAAAGGIEGAFADAYSSRELRLADFAGWMRAQEVLKLEVPRSGRALVALEGAVSRFLPGYSRLRADGGKPPKLLIDRGDKTIAVRQLSDGERGVLAMVLDLSRRLVQANPHMSDPAEQAEAIVLIDEIDLHLHPKWQRQIVQNLQAVFPNCQFIVTTHSPQVIPCVEPDQVLLMSANGVIYPDRTLGMDSNWILRYIMEVDERPASAVRVLQAVEEHVRRGAFKTARSAIARAVESGLDLPEWSVLEARMTRMELLEA